MYDPLRETGDAMPSFKLSVLLNSARLSVQIQIQKFIQYYFIVCKAFNALKDLVFISITLQLQSNRQAANIS